jgi:hypothetical protein
VVLGKPTRTRPANFTYADPVHAYTCRRSMDVGAFRPDFVFFNHRGKALPLNLPASL